MLDVNPRGRYTQYLCFVTSPQENRTAKLCSLSFLDCPPDCPSTSHSLTTNYTAASWVMAAAAGKKSKKTTPTFSPACVTDKRSARQSPFALKIAIGPIGKKSSPSKPPARPK